MILYKYDIIGNVSFRKENNMRKINNVVIILSIVVEIIYLLFNIPSDIQNILLFIVFIPVLFIPRIFNLIFKSKNIKIGDDTEFMYLIFLILAFLMGSIMHFYSLIYWWDSFAHLLSGIFTAYISLLVLKWLDNYYPKKKIFNVVFIICFVLAVAVLWECMEFTIDRVGGGDTQKVLTTGVVDTMKDMICALLGGILFTIVYIRSVINKRSVTKELFDEI